MVPLWHLFHYYLQSIHFRIEPQKVTRMLKTRPTPTHKPKRRKMSLSGFFYCREQRDPNQSCFRAFRVWIAKTLSCYRSNLVKRERFPHAVDYTHSNWQNCDLIQLEGLHLFSGSLILLAIISSLFFLLKQTKLYPAWNAWVWSPPTRGGPFGDVDWGGSSRIVWLGQMLDG